MSAKQDLEELILLVATRERIKIARNITGDKSNLGIWQEKVQDDIEALKTRINRILGWKRK